MTEEATAPASVGAQPELVLSVRATLKQRVALLGVLVIDSAFLVLFAVVLVMTTYALSRLRLHGLDLLVATVCQFAFALSTVGYLLLALLHDLLVAVARLFHPQPARRRAQGLAKGDPQEERSDVD